MSGYTSDQLVANATVDGQMVPTGQRARITGIQAEGAAGSKIVFKSGGAAGTVIATFEFGTEGIDFYVPGSGILFDTGIVYNLAGAGGSVTLTITGA